MLIAYLNGGEVPDKQALHRALAEQLAFPSWYGSNLDALYDLLSTEREPVDIVVRNPAALEQALGGYWRCFLSVLKDVGEETGRLRVELREPPEPPENTENLF